MAKFIYRMQSILDIKSKMEEQAKMAYASAQGRLREEQAKEENLILRKNSYEEQGRELRLKKLDFQEITWYDQAVKQMEEQIAEQRKRVAEAARKVEEARLRLQEVMSERKAHEKLKEKAFEDFKVELNHEENKEIDELVSYVYGQRTRKRS